MNSSPDKILQYGQRFKDFLLASILALILVSPLTGWPFLPQTGIDRSYLSIGSDEEHYAALVREVAEGHWLHRNPYLFEEKKGLPTIYMWSEVFLGQMFRVWPWGIASFVLALKWLGCMISMWLIMRISRSLYPHMSLGWSAATALAFFVLPAFLSIDAISRICQALRFNGFWSEGLAGLRFVNPIMTYVLFLGWIWLFLRYLQAPNRYKLWVVGLWLGGLVWFYVYFWIFASVVVGLMFLYSVYRLRGKEAGNFLKILFVSALGVAPYLFFIRWEMVNSPLQIVHFVHTRSVLLSAAVLVIFTTFFLRRWWCIKIKKESWTHSDFFVLVLALASLIATNQQLITNVTLQPHHFYFLINLPLAGWVASLLLFQLTECCLIRWKSVIGWMVVLFIGVLGLGVQVSTVRQVQAEFVDRLRLTQAFSWLKTQGYPLVVYADDRAAELIPVYTQADVYSAIHAAVYESTSRERRERAWFIASRLEGLVNPNDVSPVFQKQRDIIGCRIFECQYWRDYCGTYGCFPDSYLEDLTRKYQTFLQHDFAREWKMYRVDLVLWDEKLHPEWNLSQYTFLKRIWVGDGLSIWTFTL